MLIAICTSSGKDQKMCDKAIKEDSWDLANVSHLSQTHKKCNDAVSAEPCLLKYVPDFYKLQKMWYEDFDDYYKLVEWCNDNKKGVNAHFLVFIKMV